MRQYDTIFIRQCIWNSGVDKTDRIDGKLSACVLSQIVCFFIWLHECLSSVYDPWLSWYA